MQLITNPRNNHLIYRLNKSIFCSTRTFQTNKIVNLKKPLSLLENRAQSENKILSSINSQTGKGFYLFRAFNPLRNDPFKGSNDQQSEKQQNNTGKSPNNNDPKKSAILLTASLLLTVLAYSVLENSLKKAQADMQAKMNAQIEEEDKDGKSNRKQHQTPNLNIRNGTIQWNDFVSHLLANNLVSELYATKTAQIAIAVLKYPIEVAGTRYQSLLVSVSPDDIEKKLEKAQDELQLKPEQRVTVTFKNSDYLVFQLLMYAFVAYVIFTFGKVFLTRMQSAQSEFFSQFTKAKYTVIDPHLKSGVPKISFKDVAGLHEAKIEIKEFVDYLRAPERYAKLGARVPKGALLLGPPGCGKTLLAKAVAAEANVPFFNIAGSEFIEMIGGVGAARVRSLFEEAKKQSPSIIYIDEIDAIGRKRSGQNEMGSSSENDQTLNQLLVSMDGLESNSHVVVLASTNRADILDKALMRPGRLDRHILIDLPTYDERVEILNVHMQGLKLGFAGKARDEFVSRLSHLTPRFSGADLANVCNEAALMAARDSNPDISTKHFEYALERIMAGPEKKTSTITIEDRRMLAYRECGHVVISWFHKYSDLILKVSLLSRTKTSSFSQYLPSDKKLYSKEELFDQMCLYFGGRVAESIVFNRFTTKSEQDLKKITKLAFAQVESFGMNDVIGNISFPTQQEERANNNMVGERPYSRKLRALIELEVNKLIKEANLKATETIQNHRDKLNLLAEELLKKENLNYQDIIDLIGPPQNESRFKMAKKQENTSSVI